MNAPLPMINTRRNTISSVTPAVALLLVTVVSSATLAQSPLPLQTPGANAGAGPDGTRITLTRSVQPSFHIEPIVHRFAARRGAMIPFEFLIRSTGKQMDVTVIPVRLRQEETGIILHDAAGTPADEIQFTSETEFKLDAGEAFTITGTVQVPLAKSNFLSYGILVRDNGQLTDDRGGSDGNARKTRAAVRFVTQYVLRIDIETGEKDLSEMNRMVFKDGRIRAHRGMPIAEAILVNPTDFAFECYVRGEIDSPTRSRPRPFRLTMASRNNLPEDKKYLIRIMPRSRVRVSSPVAGMLFPGPQNLTLSISGGRKTWGEKSFPTRITGGDFPALETKLAYLSDSLSVEPAQIELGQIATTSRTTTLRFSNSASSDQRVAVSLYDLNGRPIPHVRLSSDDFTIRAGRSKSVRAILDRNSDLDRPVYGRLEVKSVVAEAEERKTVLPVALLFGEPAAPSIRIDELQAVEVAGHTSFRLAVTNDSEGYVPIHVDLRIADTKGRVIELADGYGRWLEPGQTRELRFLPQTALQRGEYQLTTTVKTNDNQPPTVRTLVVTLEPEPASITSNESGKDPASGEAPPSTTASDT